MAASETVQNIPHRAKTSVNGQHDENETKIGADNGDRHNGSGNDNPDATGGVPASRPVSPAANNSVQIHTTNTEKIRHIVQQSASDESKKKINALLGEIRQLPDLEKLLLYLQLPTGGTATDPFRQNCNNPLGNRFEVTQTVTWIKTHLQEDSEVSLPKHEVYEDYCHYCQMHSIKPLSTADFGKVMKHVFPSVRPRRLGTRGNSKYCYSGLRKKITLEVPKLPNLSADRDAGQDEDDILSQDGIKACSYVILEWAHKLLENKFETLKQLACHLVESKLVDARSFGAFTVLSLAPNAGKTNPASLLLNQSGGNKHRDTQLQLQRKIQEKGLIKEQKKRLNDIRADKTDAKERRRASSGPCARSMRSSSTTSAQVCSMPTTPLPSNYSPPLKSEKKENGQPVRPGKVQIPRINSNRQSPKVCIASSIILLPQLTPIADLAKNCGKSKPKYKPIQPKPSVGATGVEKKAENGVQGKKRVKSGESNAPSPVKRSKSDEEEGKSILESISDDLTHESRDVLLSQSSCDPTKELTDILDEGKAAENGNALMDFMEGSSASMEQDEELSRYFSETPTKRYGDTGQTLQLTQLRWLLEHNLKASPPAQGSGNAHTLRELLTQPVKPAEPLPSMETLTGFLYGQHATEMGQPEMVKRRVSFPMNLDSQLPTPPVMTSSVPPSPNTRCRSFNFTPISPRHTPQDMKGLMISQPPSASESPFVSPSSTPVPLSRSRHNSGQTTSYGPTPYPSEHSSAVNSPFISPHPTPVPPKSRVCTRFPVNRTPRPSNGAMTLLSPRSAPLSPMNFVAEPDLTVPSTVDGIRSRNDSSSLSPCSAPMSPQTGHNGLFSCLEGFQQCEWTQNATQGYSNVGYGNAVASNDPRVVARQRYGRGGGGVQSYSYPATPTAGHFTDLMDPSVCGFEKGKNLADVLMSSPQSYDLGTTLEDLRACDDAYSQFAQELEHQSPPKSGLMGDDDVFPSKTY